ncbi:MAG: hypothetical protein K8S56_08065 [Candidatus Cloacimonetes bacterium]|nr:hypothetical protein [Candidatus Cloacimonadota bacterium]
MEIATKQTMEERFAAVNTLKQRLEDDFITLGELLSALKRSKVFKTRGFKTFKDFVENEFNMAGSFASRLIGIFDLYIDDLDISEADLKQVGIDKLNIIKPLVKDAPWQETEQWLSKAGQLSAGELREEVKEIRDKQKQQTMKEVFIDQFFERMVVEFNCSRKELNFKLALFFQDSNLNEIKKEIRDKQKRYEETGELDINKES